MNKLIKQLAEQAEDAVGWGDPHNHDHRIQGDIEFRQKFAELIVRECLIEIPSTDLRGLHAPGFYLDLVVDHIEQHFGVE